MAIQLKDLKGKTALTILKGYEGKNPYIKKFKSAYLKKGKITLTDIEAKYIIDNHDVEPIYMNKVIEVTDFLARELQMKNGIKFPPKRILVQFILGETDKAYHIYGKLTQKQKKSKMYFLAKNHVIDDPYYEEPDIEVDFEKYTKLDQFVKKDGSVGRVPYEHQKKGIKFLASRSGAILGDQMGLGKAQPLDSKILTPFGFVNMGHLKIGDEVIGSNGTPCKVTGIFPKGKRKVYRVSFTDGSSTECCDEHLWAVQTTTHKFEGSGYKVKPLKDLMNDLTYGTKGNLKWYIPITKSVQFEKSSLNVDPYVMGCLLGDGGFTGHNIKLSSNDDELINEVHNRLPLDHKINHIINHDYQICGVNNVNLVIREFNEHGLMGIGSDSKFIPDYYKYSDINDRIELLQGLLDTDGYCAKDGTIQFYSVSKQLALDVTELVQSLGGVAKQSSKMGKYKLPNGDVKTCKECFILTINLPKTITPFKLSRKKSRVKTNKKYNPSRGIKSIEYSRTTETQCISVDAEDSLYVTDDYIVTHNTYQAIIAAMELNLKKVLIVCPASLKLNWEREIHYFQNYNTSIIRGHRWEPSQFTIINYDILKNFHALPTKTLKKKHIDQESQYMVQERFDLIIIDEAHSIKNNKAKRTKILKEVMKSIPRVWLLSGTPVANRPMDYYNLLAAVRAPVANDWMFYAKRYCEGYQFTRTKMSKGREVKQRIWITNGASNLEELAKRTRHYILRRLKSEIKDMPEKTITPLYQEMTKDQRHEYDMLWDDYVEERARLKKAGSPPKQLVELGLLRKYIAMESLPKTIELAEDIIEQGEKVIIFTNYTDELLELAEHFDNQCVVHYGQMSDKQKQMSVDSFQTKNSIKVFVGNIKSAGVGITLTEATYVIFNSLSWVPSDILQAIDRAHRIGQTSNVTVYFNLFAKSIDSRMWDTLTAKTEIINTIMAKGEDNIFIDDEEEETLLGKILENG